jgi:hypothetical protein
VGGNRIAFRIIGVAGDVKRIYASGRAIVMLQNGRRDVACRRLIDGSAQKSRLTIFELPAADLIRRWRIFC